jgi:hypothetical protein
MPVAPNHIEIAPAALREAQNPGATQADDRTDAQPPRT